MKLSIIIPAYNEEDYIADTIKSIQNAQHAVEYEILVACNGCTDNTVDIVKQLEVTAVICPVKGAAEASNYVAKEHAKGGVFVFLDADTVVSKNLFLEIAQAVKGGSIGGRTVVKWEGNNIFARSSSLVSYVHKYKWGGFCFVTKDIFEKVGGYKEGFIYGFDFDLGQRVTKEGKVSFLRKAYVVTSARRFRKEGWLKHGWLATKRFYYDHLFKKKGLKTDDDIDYKKY